MVTQSSTYPYNAPVSELEREIVQSRCAIRQGRPAQDDINCSRSFGSVYFYSRKQHITVYADDMQFAMITAKRGI